MRRLWYGKTSKQARHKQLKAISQNRLFHGILAILGVAFFACVLGRQIVKPLACPLPVFVGAAALTLITGGCYLKQNEKYKTAKLIVSNPIFTIQHAVVDSWEDPAHAVLPKNEAIEATISCFGILLDREIVKFNLDGISLHSVEIGLRHITLAYGTGNQSSQIRISHRGISEGQMLSMAERFRFETGLSPRLEGHTEI